MPNHLLIEIARADDERIRPFRSLKGRRFSAEDGPFVLVESELGVERLLRIGRPVSVLFMERKFYERFDDIIPQAVPLLYTASQHVMEQIVGYRLHQGVLALAPRPPYVRSSELDLPIVVLNGLCDPENVGAIMRTAAAFGVRSILADRSTSDPLIRRSIRVSMGAALELDIARVDDLEQTILEMRTKADVVAVETGPASVPLDAHEFRRDTVLIFGSERTGIEPRILRAASRAVCIPLAQSGTRSINVAAAAAIALQRLHAGTRHAETASR